MRAFWPLKKFCRTYSTISGSLFSSVYFSLPPPSLPLSFLHTHTMATSERAMVAWINCSFDGFKHKFPLNSFARRRCRCLHVHMETRNSLGSSISILHTFYGLAHIICRAIFHAVAVVIVVIVLKMAFGGDIACEISISSSHWFFSNGHINVMWWWPMDDGINLCERAPYGLRLTNVVYVCDIWRLVSLNSIHFLYEIFDAMLAFDLNPDNISVFRPRQYEIVYRVHTTPIESNRLLCVRMCHGWVLNGAAAAGQKNRKRKVYFRFRYIECVYEVPKTLNPSRS